MKKEPIGNLGLRILALVLAVVLWFYITKGLGLERNVEERVFTDVPVKVLSAGAGHIVAKVTPRKITLKLRGARSVLKKLTAEKILVFVDASTFEEGRYERIPIRVDFPPGVEVATGLPVCAVILEEIE